MRFVATSADIVLFRDAVKLWGLQAQVIKALEEISELGVELSRGLLGETDYDKVADEVADVYIVLHSIVYGFGISERTDKRVGFKMERLASQVAHDCPGWKVRRPKD